MKTETRDTIIWVFCIVILLLLSSKLYFAADDYTCNECRMKLSSKQVYNEWHDVGAVRVDILFEAYKEGECLIGWDPVGGFINNGYFE